MVGFEKLPKHHIAWLSVHPDRSIEWFKRALREGFDVHHMDGDRRNNDPENLVLIETADHMNLHGRSSLRRLYRVGGVWGDKPGNVGLTEGKEPYEMRLAGMKWTSIAEKLGRPSVDGQKMTYRARLYAEAHNLEWPIDVPG